MRYCPFRPSLTPFCSLAAYCSGRGIHITMDVHCDASLLLPCVHNLTISLLDISSWITFPAVDAGLIKIPPLPTIRVPRRLYPTRMAPAHSHVGQRASTRQTPSLPDCVLPWYVKCPPCVVAAGTPRSRADGAIVWLRAISPDAPR
jgi:hypothetical protein